MPLIAALGNYKQNYSVTHFKYKEKSISTMERLKAFSVEKFTLNGRKFHTLTILSAKFLLRVLLTQRVGLYSLYAWPLAVGNCLVLSCILSSTRLIPTDTRVLEYLTDTGSSYQLVKMKATLLLYSSGDAMITCQLHYTRSSQPIN